MAIAVFTSFGQLCDSNGVPLAGGTVTVQDAGTTTSRACYTDTGLSVPATNPIPLDSSGRHTQGMVYISAAAYKVIVKDSSGSTVFTRDNIDPGVPVGSGALAIANGGTGATDAATALTNLGAATVAQITSLSEEVAEIAGAVGSTGSTQLATGTTAQRPSDDLTEGMIRRNTTTHRTEGYNDQSVWENYLTDTEIASQSDMETPTSDSKVVAAGLMHHHPGVAKAWGYVAANGTLVTGHNVASINKAGNGVYEITLTTEFSSSDYAVIGMINDHASSVLFTIETSARTASKITIRTYSAANSSSSSLSGSDHSFYFAAFGDQ
jgi:hypothetical protein